MSKKTKFVLLGCGGHARSIANVILGNNAEAKLLFVDQNARPGEQIMGFPVVCELTSEEEICPAVGDNLLRKKLCEGRQLYSVIANNAFVGRESVVGEGSFLGFGAYVGPQVVIGKGTIVNTHAVIEHNVSAGCFCHFAPNSTICGAAEFGDNVFVGAGAVVQQGVKVCANVIIGAGAVVIKDITEAGTYVGVPVKRLDNLIKEGR